MKHDPLNLTIEELDILCQLYMECKLTALEEKELEYALTRTDLSSPAIDEVRSLTGIRLLPRPETPAVRRRHRAWSHIAGMAAGLAVVVTLAIYLFRPSATDLSGQNHSVYIAAYSHGKPLSDTEAITATGSAMARADSLMRVAAAAERDHMRRAESIISETFNN